MNKRPILMASALLLILALAVGATGKALLAQTATPTVEAQATPEGATATAAPEAEPTEAPEPTEEAGPSDTALPTAEALPTDAAAATPSLDPTSETTATPAEEPTFTATAGPTTAAEATVEPEGTAEPVATDDTSPTPAEPVLTGTPAAAGAVGAVALPREETFVAVSLTAGFGLDPFIVPVAGYGDANVANLPGDCSGYVAAEPGVVLNWSGQTTALRLFVYSDDDATLVVRTPAGEFLCSDDASVGTLDPLIVLEDPEPGAYEVHVGAHDQDGVIMGYLAITESEVALEGLDLSPLLKRKVGGAVSPSLPSLSPSVLATEQLAVFGSAELAPGFAELSVPVAGGGDLGFFTIKGAAKDCAGFGSLVPSFSLDWTGEGGLVRILFESEEDASLFVVAPDGALLCNADASSATLNPALSIAAPLVGQYDIYVANAAPYEIVVGDLIVTEDATREPAILATGRE